MFADCFGGGRYCLLLLLLVGIMINCLWFTCCKLGFTGLAGCGYICIVLCCLLWSVCFGVVFDVIVASWLF